MLTSVPQIPLPHEKPGVAFEIIRSADLYRQWRISYEQAHPALPIENIRFAHDPHWKDSFWCLTNAREQRHVIWKATGVGFAMGGSALAVGPMIAGGLPLALTLGLVTLPWVVKWFKKV
mgnify:CR=1 FL=1